MWLKAKVAVMETMHTPVPSVERVALPTAAATITTQVPIPEPVVERVPIPEASIEPVAAMPDDLRRQYVALSVELGIVQPGLLKDDALAFFRDRGTRIYDGAKVKAYLDDQYGKETQHAQQTGAHCNCCDGGRHVSKFHAATWGWRPLRASDRNQPPPPPLQSNNNMVWIGDPGYRGSTNNDAIWNDWHIALYAKPLPLPVLLTVKEVVSTFPTARCFVSDDVSREAYQAGLRPVLDPFLLIIIEGERFIIERWDEPGYRE